MKPINTTQRAEMPMPGGRDQQRLLRSLENGSLYDLALELPKLAKSLQNYPVIRANQFVVTQTVKTIEEDRARGWKLLHLLYSMNRSAIRAIVGNTVAYDTFTSEAKWFQMPGPTEGKVAGVYVIGLGRPEDGKFLNIEEILKLADGIENYIAGYHEIKWYHRQRSNQGRGVGPTVLSTAQQAVVDWVNKVDRGLLVTRPVPEEARYIKQDLDVSKMKALAVGLRKRCNSGLDPTHKIRQIQSPLYVGCSIDLRSRTNKYTRNGLVDMNKPLALTVQVLEALGISMRLYVQVALRIWEQDQLARAEQLITTLAGSLVYQHGFNATEAGGTGSNSIRGVEGQRALDESRDLIMVRSSIMNDHLTGMLSEIDQRTDFVEDLHHLSTTAVGLLADIEACEGEATKVTFNSDTNWEDVQKQFRVKESEVSNVLHDLQLLERQCEMLYKLTRTMYPDAAAALDAETEVEEPDIYSADG